MKQMMNNCILMTPIRHHAGELSLLKFDGKTNRYEKYPEYAAFKRQSFGVFFVVFVFNVSSTIFIGPDSSH